MVDGNSHRDNVKDALKGWMNPKQTEDEDLVNAESATVADIVFEALGITEDEQDKVGGYFILHAAKRYEGEELVPDVHGEFNDTVLTSQVKTSDYKEMYPDEVNAYTKRTKELADGAKYAASEFKARAVGNSTPNGWYVRLATPICRYGQLYDKDMTLEEAKTNFVNTYYTMYLDDYERSTGQVD